MNNTNETNEGIECPGSIEHKDDPKINKNTAVLMARINNVIDEKKEIIDDEIAYFARSICNEIYHDIDIQPNSSSMDVE